MYRSRQPVQVVRASTNRTIALCSNGQTRASDCSTLCVEDVSFAQRTGGPIMPLIQLVEVLIVVGVLLWLVNRFIPMAGSVKSILNAVVVIALVVWILRVAGLWNSLANIRVG